MRIGVDTGGTFTDVVREDGPAIKLLSTPSDPSAAVREGIDEAADGPVELLAHGTTVATNALLERDGAAVTLVTTSGLADVIEIGRQDRPSLYDAGVTRPEPLVPRGRRRVEVQERLAADGSVLVPLDVADMPAVPAGTEAVAVSLLHADLEPAHEQALAAALRAQGFDVCASHEVSPEMREYERTSTTVINAFLRPRVRSYLAGLRDAAEVVQVMTSAGGLVPLDDAVELPAAMLLSGPAGGVLAAASAAMDNGFADAVTFDMGGTSTDVCLVLDGRPAPAAQREVAGFSVRFPSLDIHTIGAGGGSIAHIDPGGALVVGPRSAGADPGPACYGRGGSQPTVTDADLVAERISADGSFGGLRLDADAALSALDGTGVTAEGVTSVVDANMERALRKVSVERGVDPRGLALVAFGGAGPLHACALAEALDMTAVIVPSRAGVLSAVGLLTAPVQRDLVRSWPSPGEHAGLEGALHDLAREATGLVGTGAEVATSVDCRYAGQSHELTVPAPADFHAEHLARNGFSRPHAPVEIIALRATARIAAPMRTGDLTAVERAAVVGPTVLAEDDCTIWVPEGWLGEPGEAGALVLRRGG